MRYVGIDPSTRTGFVVLDKQGNVVRAKELTGVGSKDPKRMVTLIDEVIAHVRSDDVICIENFGFASRQAIQMGGIGWGIRMALFRRGWQYIDVAPGQLKKFASGKGNTKKDELAVHIYKRWGFEHSSDNVRDAFVLARIGWSINNDDGVTYTATKAEREVIDAVLNPKEKKKVSR